MAVDIPVRVILDVIDKASDKLKTTAKGLGDLTSEQKLFAGAMAGVGAGTILLGKQFVDAAGQMEQWNVAFETMLGSSDKAKSLLNEISDFAKKTPFNLPQLIDGSKRLLAYNVEAEKIIPTMTMLGNIAAGVGTEKLPQLILAFGQVKAATKLTGAELRQFSEAGVPLLQALLDKANATGGVLKQIGGISKKDGEEMASLSKKIAQVNYDLDLMKKYGKDTGMAFEKKQHTLQELQAELGKYGSVGQAVFSKVKIQASDMIDRISDGDVTFKEVNDALMTMSSEGGKFFNLMDKQSATTLGKMANFEDGIFRLKVALGNALLPAVNTVLDKIVPLAEKFAEWASKNPDLVVKILALGAAIGTLGTGILVASTAVNILAGAFTTLKGVFMFFNGPAAAKALSAVFAPLLANPITWVILAIAGAIALLALAWKNNWGDIQGKTKAAIESIKMFIENLRLKFEEFRTFITGIPQMIADAWEAFKIRLYNFFVVDIPYAIGWLVGRFEKFVNEDVPNFITRVSDWFAQLPGRIEQWLMQMKDKVFGLFTQAKDVAIEKTTSLVETVTTWFSELPGKIESFVRQIPDMVTKWFTNAKDSAVNIAKSLYEDVTGWIGKVIGFFNDLIGKANEAIGKSREAFNAGRDSGRRQFGGPVSAASPVLVGEAGPEMFVPSTAGRIIPNNQMKGGGTGGANIQFIINASMIINSPSERRNIAEALYKDLVSIARAQNRTVAELFGA